MTFNVASQEELIVGVRHGLVPTPELRAMAAMLGPGRVLQYGWPTVVLQDARGHLKFAPLLVVQFAPLGEHDVMFTPVEAAGLNPALLDGSGLDPADIEELSNSLAGPLPDGLPAAMQVLLESVAARLGFPCESLDPARLSGHLPKAVGVHNVATVVATEPVSMTLGLIKELKELRTRTDWRETAARYLIPELPVAVTADLDSTLGVVLAAPWQVNDAQEQALIHVRDKDLTVITGPPGTGKSQVVAGAVANAWLANRTVLLASTNNAAVDVAVDRTALVHSGLLLRTGSQLHRELLQERITHARSKSASFSGSVAPLQKKLHLAALHRTSLLGLLAEISAIESSMTRAVLAAEDAANEVWGASTPPLLLDSSIVLARARSLTSAWLFPGWRRRRFLQSISAPSSFTMEQVIAWAEPCSEFEGLRPKVLQKHEELSAIPATLAHLDGAWTSASQEAVQAVVSTRFTSRAETLSSLTGRSTGSAERAAATERAMSCARGWACTALSMASNFPLKSALFDQVIIDEASQCSLAHALPLAYRAKRLTVVGDPSQLTPIVKLQAVQADRLAQQCGADRTLLRQRCQDHLDGSAYLAFQEAVGTDKVLFLDEHYRCHPAIARWFNRTFYGDALTILTDTSAMPKDRRGMAWLDVRGQAVRGPTGSWVNRDEADEAMRLVRDLIQSGRTVGVVSPFSAQANLISTLVRKEFSGEQLGAIDFTSATAHRLQGDERDVIIFSSVVAPGLDQRAARWIESARNLMNVAASRARQHLVVVGHPTQPAALNMPTLVALRAAALACEQGDETAWGTASRAEERLLRAMYDGGLEPLLKPMVEGFELDFAVLRDGLKLDIEVDGEQLLDTRGRQRRRDVARDRVLDRLGWRVLRFPGWRCLHEPEVVVREIAAFVDAN